MRWIQDLVLILSHIPFRTKNGTQNFWVSNLVVETGPKSFSWIWDRVTVPSFVVGSNDSYRVILKTLEKQDRKHWIMHDRLDHMGILSIQNVHPPPHQKKSCCAENLDTGRVNEAIDVPWPKFSARRSEGYRPSEFSQLKYFSPKKN